MVQTSMELEYRPKRYTNYRLVWFLTTGTLEIDWFSCAPAAHMSEVYEQEISAISSH